METPSSTTKRVTRSQALAALNSNTAATNNNNIPISRKMEDSEKGVSKSRRRNAKQQQDRSALIDITNDSPIVGLAMGNLETPSSGIAKQRSGIAKSTNTPGSGEALLRGQVKTLLQKVEEEAELSKLSLQNRPFLLLQGFNNSPMGLLAPTPANTPQVPNLSEDILASVTPSPILEEQIKISEVVVVVVNDLFDGTSLESQKSLTRSLMLDFTEKSEISDVSSECSSVLTSKENPPATDDDNASLWSLQVNASSRDEDEIEEEEQEEGTDGWLVDELCEGISNMCVDENRTGKHTRYVYNSDDEIVDEEVDGSLSPNVVRLKGLPTPKGKHLRFQTEE